VFEGVFGRCGCFDFWTGTVVCVVWEGRKGGKEGEGVGSKAARRQGGKASSSIGQLDPYHTPLPSAPSCVTICDSTPLPQGSSSSSNQIRSTYLASQQSTHLTTIPWHSITQSLFNLTPLHLDFPFILSYENNFYPVNNITHPFPFPFPSLRSHSLSAPARYHSRRSIT
jgi:hypothetical protein